MPRPATAAATAAATFILAAALSSAACSGEGEEPAEEGPGDTCE